MIIKEKLRHSSGSSSQELWNTTTQLRIGLRINRKLVLCTSNDYITHLTFRLNSKNPCVHLWFSTIHGHIIDYKNLTERFGHRIIEFYPTL